MGAASTNNNHEMAPSSISGGETRRDLTTPVGTRANICTSKGLVINTALVTQAPPACIAVTRSCRPCSYKCTQHLQLR